MLLHGISSGSASWLLQLESWLTTFRVVAWDAPGYGASSPLPSPAPSARDYSAALRRLLQGCVQGRVHLVGHSLGALVAAAYCRMFPHDVRSLTLLNPALGYGDQAENVRREKLSARLEQMRQLGPEGIAAQRAPQLVSARASDLAVDVLVWNARRLSAQGYSQAAHMLAHGNLLDDLRALRLPLLVITGSEDRVTPPGSAAMAAQTHPAARVVSLPGVGHASYLECPDGVAAAFIPFAMEWA